MSGILAAASGGLPLVVLPTAMESAYQPVGSACYSGIKIDNDGNIYRCESSSLTWSLYTPTGFDGTWKNVGAVADYDVLVTSTGASALGGTETAFDGSEAAGTWYNLATDRSFYYYIASVGEKGMSGTLQLAPTGDHARILATATLDIYAYAEL